MGGRAGEPSARHAQGYIFYGAITTGPYLQFVQLPLAAFRRICTGGGRLKSAEPRLARVKHASGPINESPRECVENLISRGQPLPADSSARARAKIHTRNHSRMIESGYASLSIYVCVANRCFAIRRPDRFFMLLSPLCSLFFSSLTESIEKFHFCLP